MEKERPTCGYFPMRHCERPRECPIHGPVLKRPKKPTHVLRPGVAPFSWGEGNPDSAKWHWTLCGISLYQHGDLKAEWKKIDEKVSDPKERFVAYGLVSSAPGFKEPPIPSTIPGVTPYFVVGWSWAEAMVVVANPTCKSCLKSYRKPVRPKLVPAQPKLVKLTEK